MQTELEQRLERLLTSLPGPTATAERQARRAAVDALPPPRRRRSPVAVRTVAVAAACLVVIMAGVAIAARPDSLINLRRIVAPTPKAGHPTGVPHARVPVHAQAFSVQVGGRVWVLTPDIGALRGVPLAAVAMSPEALYLVGQTGRRLEAISIADRHVAWSRALAGRLAGAAWSPYPIRIAYVAGSPHREQLHVIWGNGTRDELIGRAAPVVPAWRSDSLAYAYVTPRHEVLVRTIGAGKPARINNAATCQSGHQVIQLAFAPHSATLVEVTDRSDLILADTRRPGHARCIDITAPAGHAEWLTRDSLAYIQPHANTLTQIRLRHEQIAASGTVTIRGTIAGFTSSPDGRRIAIAVNTDRHLRILVIDPPTFGNVAAATVRQQLSLETRRGAVAQLDWR